MLTDEDLTRQLRDAFRGDAGDMTYDRAAPRPRTRPAWARPGLVALPTVGAVAAAVLVLGSVDDPTPPAPRDVTTAAPSTGGSTGGSTGSSTAAPTAGETDAADPGTEEIELAGMTFTVRQQAGDTSMGLLAEYPLDELPAWAEPVELESGASAKVWVGVDPQTGRASMVVESPVRWGGRLTGLASPDLSLEQMTEVARSGRLS
ncbi:hypothetical protein F4692_002018 [Nocardioides cavernae]|uniref:Uncharacterized protein n=1 Tax=Nocardioides cavernae TaxID=1921566 RepID=A0A7Y9H2Y8_9ACTN|nr:hypothetical protein [Nocardioides cavernae]NYE36885.1 hypothetical protein [Nocardioides cavernae]